MIVLVAPISGGFFVNQVELISLFLESGDKPDICMSTSGGNMATYMGLLSKWDPAVLRKNALRMNDTFIVRHWGSQKWNIIPKEVWGVLYGSLYDHGEGDPFPPLDPGRNLANETEIWTTAFNRTQNRTAYFTNRAVGTTKMTYTTSYIRCLSLQFVNGDYPKLRNITMASAAVPGVIREVIIDGEYYVDGGMHLASPFLAFQENLRDYARTQQMHIVYVNCMNLDNAATAPRSNSILSDAQWAVGQLTYGHLCSDLSAVISFICSAPGFDSTQHRIVTEHFTGTRENLLHVAERRKNYHCTVTEMYPTHNRSIDYTSFTPSDTESIMSLCRQYFGIKFHYFK